jgi:phosphoribosylformylglycinamidine synthase I
MKSAVITFPGSNCDRDAVVALQKIGSKVMQIWHQESKLDDDFDLIVVPGGFTYGDYLRVGAMASISPAMTEVKRLAARGTKILGICNGFQILTEAGLLPGALTRNKEMKFVCRQIHLRVEDNSTAFTKKYQKHQAIKIPVAHMDGNFFADVETLKKIEGEGMVAFRYCDENGNVSETSNFNGSQLGIAGVFNEKKNVLGLMPHPERAIDINTGSSDGLAMFEGFLSL